jgi:serine/threonine-protein kinase
VAAASSSLLPLAAVFAAAAAVLFGLWKFLGGLAAEPPPTVIVAAPISAPAPALAPAPAPAPTPVAEGVVGGNYEIRRQLGMGGMGVVYEAWDRALDRRVALKKMRPEIGSSPRGRDRFLSEAKLVAKLSHPNIVGIHQIIEESGDLYLVFEYVDGITLDELLLREKFIAPPQALGILRGVSDAVDAAHREKVIHRDLKPANIMIDKTGRPKVMDFGIAHQAKLTVSQMTVAEAFGSLAYMPPEQELGKAVRESDIYAFAAVTYELLTGGLPFPGPNFHLQKSSLSFLRPSQADATLPRALDPVFERAFQPEPKARFPTTSEFVAVLSDILKT